MPRPQRCRMVSNLPKFNKFIPEANNIQSQEEIVMSIDEYETIKLIDYKRNDTRRVC